VAVTMAATVAATRRAPPIGGHARLYWALALRRAPTMVVRRRRGLDPCNRQLLSGLFTMRA
jgi:hypothetical protein